MMDANGFQADERMSHMRHALSLARKAPPKPTNFCVGAVLVDEVTDEILSTGHTMELAGNTHAEQCCLMKLTDEMPLNRENPMKLALYTTMEPCNMRASGNISCTQTILESKGKFHGDIETVYVGVKEPEKFVGENTGKMKLETAGIKYVHLPGLEEEILAVATRGHEA